MNKTKASQGMRWEQIAADVRHSIDQGQLTPGTRLPSETELAEQYNVCRMTAHRAMHELQNLGLVERRRRLGTVVAAQALRRTGRIAVLAYKVDEFLNASYLRGLREGLPPDFQLLLCDTRGQGQLEAQFLKKMREDADAIVCFLSSEMSNDELLQNIVVAGIPLVCLDRAAHETQADAIVSDNYGASVEALRLLVARGHRRIAHFTDHRWNISSIRERYEAHRDVLTEIGETDPAKWVRYFTAYAVGQEHYFEHLSQSVYDALFTLMRQDEPPTAIFCMNDAYMAAVMQACQKLNIDVPGELEIVSFNDQPPQYLPLPYPVLRIVQQPRTMGVLAGERVARRLGGEFMPPEVLRVPAILDDMVSKAAYQPIKNAA